jgi:hypothetical protein
MASELNKRLQAALGPVLKASGFRKDAATWRKSYEASIGVVNLQGSQWGPSFFVNLGVYFRALGSKAEPLEYDCHVRTRLEELVTDRVRLTTLLDWDKPVSDTDRFAELQAALMDGGVSWLARVSDIEGAREYCRGLDARSPWVTAEARRLLMT